MKLTVKVWVIPICINRKWTFLDKVYTKKGYALTAIKARNLKKNYEVSEPVEISQEIELPDCEVCGNRFKCYTT